MELLYVGMIFGAAIGAFVTYSIMDRMLLKAKKLLRKSNQIDIVVPYRPNPSFEIHYMIMGDGRRFFEVRRNYCGILLPIKGADGKREFATMEEAEQAKRDHIKSLNAQTIVSDYTMR